jgi:Molecular chaperone
MMYNVVIGWDFGHGENSIWAFRLSSNEPAILNLDSEKNRQLMSLIAYDGNSVLIGSEARTKMSVIPYFKRDPSNWTAIIPGRNISYKKAMSDFFKKLMEDIRNYNPEYIQPNDKILLVVGCPSNSIWTNDENRTAYEALIKEAAGADEVKVMPESRAAMIGFFSPTRNLNINTSNGAIVLDLGSSTLDFTYMLFGKYLIERSCTLGAHHIEMNMLKKVLQKAGISLKDVYIPDINVTLIDFRAFKEAYYNKTLGRSKTIHSFELVDLNGDRIVVDKKEDGSPKYQEKDVIVDIDDDFMKSVINDSLVEISSGNISLGRDSWQGHLETFLRKVKLILDSKHLSYETVLLTGGASAMPFVKKLCREIFGVEPHIEMNPSHSVSSGLAMAGKVDLELPGLFEGAIKNILEKSDLACLELKDECSKNIAEYAYNQILPVLESVRNGGDITLGQFKALIEHKLEAILTRDVIQRLMTNPNENFRNKCSQLVVDSANIAARRLYPGMVAGNQLRMLSTSILNNALPDTLVNSNDIIGNMNFNSILTSIINGIIRVIGYAIALAAAVFIPVIGPVVAVIAWGAMEIIIDWFNTHDNHKLIAGVRNSIYNNFTNNRDKEIKNLVGKLKPELNNVFTAAFGENNEIHNATMTEVTKHAFDIVSLNYFETVDEE